MFGKPKKKKRGKGKTLPASPLQAADPDYDTKKVDEIVLALLKLTSHRDHKDGPVRAWKGHDWDALNRLHEKGWISNPASKSKSVELTNAGLEKSTEYFEKYFGKS